MSEEDKKMDELAEDLDNLEVDKDDQSSHRDSDGEYSDADGSTGTPTDVAETSESKVSSSTRVTAKFLMSNAAAGSIIGKSGANITELQSKSHARLQLSRATEFFPGTQDRVLLVSGPLEKVVAAVGMVMNTVDPELVLEPNGAEQGHKRFGLKFLLPSATCGVLIGRAGATIRGFSKDSGAQIAVSGVHEQLPGVSDRVTLISGTREQILEALTLILEKLKDSPHYNRLSNVPVTYHSGNYMGWAAPHYGSPQAMAPIHMAQATHPALTNGGMPTAPMTAPHEVMIPVPDAKIGAVIGKGGEIITQLKTLVGVRIRISNRDVFVPGTRNRKVIISGPPDAVHIASQLIQQKVVMAGQSPLPTARS